MRKLQRQPCALAAADPGLPQRTCARHLALMQTLVPVHATYPSASHPGSTYLQDTRTACQQQICAVSHATFARTPPPKHTHPALQRPQPQPHHKHVLLGPPCQRMVSATACSGSQRCQDAHDCTRSKAANWLQNTASWRERWHPPWQSHSIINNGGRMALQPPQRRTLTPRTGG
jgi:hypothetical protein